MPPDKHDVYEKAGILDNQIGYGSTPALLVIDLQCGFTDTDHPFGADLSAVIQRTNQLIESAHVSNSPVIVTRIITKHPEGRDLGIWIEKAPDLATLTAGSRWVAIDDRLALQDTDHILDKRQASAFHETELNSMLTARGIDTLVVTGCSTSGCIRASVVDACAYGYRPIVPDGCVGDRAAEPHDANLFDMKTKYADVRPLAEVQKYLATLETPTPVRS